MAVTPEKKVKEQCVKILKEEKCYYFFPVQMGLGRAGIPDIICCVDGYFLAIECKAGKNVTTRLQDKELEKINASGGAAVVVREDEQLYLRGVIKLCRARIVK